MSGRSRRSASTGGSTFFRGQAGEVLPGLRFAQFEVLARGPAGVDQGQITIFFIQGLFVGPIEAGGHPGQGELAPDIICPARMRRFLPKPDTLSHHFQAIIDPLRAAGQQSDVVVGFQAGQHAHQEGRIFFAKGILDVGHFQIGLVETDTSGARQAEVDDPIGMGFRTRAVHQQISAMQIAVDDPAQAGNLRGERGGRVVDKGNRVYQKFPGFTNDQFLPPLTVDKVVEFRRLFGIQAVTEPAAQQLLGRKVVGRRRIGPGSERLLHDPVGDAKEVIAFGAVDGNKRIEAETGDLEQHGVTLQIGIIGRCDQAGNMCAGKSLGAFVGFLMRLLLFLYVLPRRVTTQLQDVQAAFDRFGFRFLSNVDPKNQGAGKPTGQGVQADLCLRRPIAEGPLDQLRPLIVLFG